MAEVLDLLSIIPATTSRGNKIHREIFNGKIRFSYTCKFTRPEAFEIKRFIELNDLFFEGYGLIQGDGDKSNFIGFTNSEFSILKRFLDFIEMCFAISRYVFSVRLFLPPGKNPGKEISKVVKELGVKRKQIIGFDFRKNHKSVVVNLYKRTRLINIVFRELYRVSRNRSKGSKTSAIPFLRGIIASDGTVQRKNTTTSLFAVKISSNDIENKKLYKHLLKLCGISYGKDERDCIPIRHFRNFSKMKKYDLIRISERKYRKFTEGFRILEINKKKLLDHGITKGRVVKILGSQGPMTIPELLREIRKMRKSQDRPTLYRHLWELEKRE